MDIVINGRFLTQQITGVQRYAHEVVRAIDDLLDSRRDLTVTMLSPPLAVPPPRWRNVIHRQVGRLGGHAWEQLELPRFCPRDAVLFCPGNTAPVAALLRSQRVVVTVHDLSYRYFPEAYSRAFRLWYGAIVPLVLRRADAVITVSEAERRAIASHYPEATPRLHAIQNGGLPAGHDAEAAASRTAERSHVLYVGSLSKRKNFPAALEVACGLARKRGLRFVFVGGVAASLSSSAMGVPDDVATHLTFAGQVDDAGALIRYYGQATCLLFPSLYESSGLPPIEAMACGCPVVASAIPALRDRCGDAAVYCDPNDIASIATAVERVVDDPDLRLRLQTLGYRRAATYTWERCAQEVLRVLTGVSETAEAQRHSHEA